MKGVFFYLIYNDDEVNDINEDPLVSAIVLVYLKGPHELAIFLNSEKESVIAGIYNSWGLSIYYVKDSVNSEAIVGSESFITV
jgi:hypothetical protein